MQEEGKRILILGGSGFIGNALYKELCNYYATFGTYFSSKKGYAENQQFYQYDMQEDDIFQLLENLRPTVIISALRGDFAAQIQAHAQDPKHISSAARVLMRTANTLLTNTTKRFRRVSMGV